MGGAPQGRCHPLQLCWEYALPGYQVLQHLHLHLYLRNPTSISTRHWESSKQESRVDWVKGEVKSYYRGEGRRREHRRDRRRRWRAGKGEEEVEEEEEEVCPPSPLRVVDVGSCYNPFHGEPGWQVDALDIAPATPGIKPHLIPAHRITCSPLIYHSSPNPHFTSLLSSHPGSTRYPSH